MKKCKCGKKATFQFWLRGKESSACSACFLKLTEHYRQGVAYKALKVGDEP